MHTHRHAHAHTDKHRHTHSTYITTCAYACMCVYICVSCVCVACTFAPDILQSRMELGQGCEQSSQLGSRLDNSCIHPSSKVHTNLTIGNLAVTIVFCSEYVIPAFHKLPYKIRGYNHKSIMGTKKPVVDIGRLLSQHTLKLSQVSSNISC